MSQKPKIAQFKSLAELVVRLRNDLTNADFVLLYAYNRTGKTRLSMEFKERGKRGGRGKRDTLYFNAFTEDLFWWDNDLENNSARVLKINGASQFFAGLQQLALEEKIFAFLERYADFDFKIDYEQWLVSFNKGDHLNIKISRGEETVFKWCVFLAICQLALEGAEAYKWVKFIFIDDPISSLDDNNAIAIASDLARLLTREETAIKTVITSHHILFFNVLCNELKQKKFPRYFLHKAQEERYTLRKTNDTPFFHHVASLSELSQAVASDRVQTYHFNVLRSILEKTSSFFGFDDFGKCLQGMEDDVLFNRALNLLSHGQYSVYQPIEMTEDNKQLFRKILETFLARYDFYALSPTGNTAVQAPQA